MNTKQQGDIGVAKAIYIYTALGYTISIPNTDNAKYDLIVEKDKIYKVQVKTTTYKTKYGIYQTMLRTSGGNQSWSKEYSRIDPSDVDLVFILTEGGICYEFPSEVLKGCSTVNLGKDKDIFRVELDRW